MNRNSPSGVRISWQGTAPTFAALPLAGNGLGDVRVTTATGELWIWNGAAWVPPTGLSTDERVKVTAADTTPGFLADKLPTTSNVLANVTSPGADEDLELAVVGITESGGPTSLAIGAIPNPSVLTRSGGSIVGVPAGAISSGVLFWGNGSVAATTATRHLDPGYQTALAPLPAAIVQTRAPISGVLRNLFVRQNGPAGNGNPIVYTVRVNGVATALLVSIPSTTSDASNIVASVPVTAGDLIDIQVTKALAVGTSPSRIAATLEIGP